MRKFLMAAALTLGLLLPSEMTLAVAENGNYYGDSSRAVAKDINCKRFFYPKGSGSGAYNKDSGVCWLKGKRVNVITFKGPVQQREWNAAARVALPKSFWWANGKGALIVARNGNKAAATVGGKVLPGKLAHGTN